MDELMIKSHNFESSKNQIKAFTEQSKSDLVLSNVDISGGIFNLGKHKVTGDELNNITAEIQSHLMNHNKKHVTLIKEFGQVYNALEALDKDYIQSILIAIKSAEKANVEVSIAQGDITKTIQIQKKTITILNQFKEKLEQFDHLKDIDSLWNKSEILNTEVTEINERVNAINNIIGNQDQSVSILFNFKDKVDSYEHLKDIDSLWNKSKNLNTEVIEINKRVNATNNIVDYQDQSISILFNFKDKIDSYDHLKHIDSLWNKCNKNETDIFSLNNIINDQNTRLNDLANSLKDTQKQNDEKDQIIAKKIKQLYIVTSGSFGIAFLTFVFLLLRGI